MENEPEMIRHQMEETRASLQDKLETLEQQVTETVQNAAEAATETVQSVKEAVQETVETVRGTVEETVHSVKDTFDLHKQVNDHPWIALTGAAAAGFVAARLLYPQLPQPFFTSEPMMAGPAAPEVPEPHRNGSTASSGDSHGSGLFSGLFQHYGDELAKLRALGVGVAAAAIREMLVTSMAPALAQQVGEIVDSLTVKIGGKPVAGSVFRKSEDDAPSRSGASANLDGYPQTMQAGRV